MIAAVTELNLKNFWCYLRFLPHALSCKIQAERSPGLIFIQLNSKNLLVQRTLTVWKNEKCMEDYVKSTAHMRAMKVFSKISKRSTTARFTVKSLPSWSEALQQLKKNGREHGQD